MASLYLSSTRSITDKAFFLLNNFSGTAMALGPSILPVFEQLGLLEDLKTFAQPIYSVDMYTEQIEKLGSVDMTGHDKL